VPVIPDDDPSATSVFILKDLKSALSSNPSVDEDTVEKVVTLLAAGKSVEVNDGQLYIVPVGTGLFEVYVKE